MCLHGTCSQPFRVFEITTHSCKPLFAECMSSASCDTPIYKLYYLFILVVGACTHVGKIAMVRRQLSGPFSPSITWGPGIKQVMSIGSVFPYPLSHLSVLEHLLLERSCLLLTLFCIQHPAQFLMQNRCSIDVCLITGTLKNKTVGCKTVHMCVSMHLCTTTNGPRLHNG